MALNEPDFAINEILKNIKDRRSIRSFAKEEIPDEEIGILLQAANAAPSAHNLQSWRFIVLKGGKKQKLAELVAEGANRFSKPAQALLRMSARSIASAPVVIAVANSGELIEHGTELFKVEKVMAFDFFRTMEIQSSAAAVQNLLLAATSLGLATVWLGIMFLMKDEVLEFLGVPGGEFMAVVPVGHPSREAGSGPPKKPFDLKVTYLD
ncbi:MAG: nitroreductase family protein [Desulfuromonadaceae bacterium]|nr:nitroreductase family protein [Desulfuromonadaceae bacterium]